MQIWCSSFYSVTSCAVEMKLPAVLCSVCAAVSKFSCAVEMKLPALMCNVCLIVSKFDRINAIVIITEL